MPRTPVRDLVLVLLIGLTSGCGAQEGARDLPVEEPHAGHASLDEVFQALGKLELRIEVRPGNRYPFAKAGTIRPRLQDAATFPWQGTPQEFDAFKSEEVASWQRARDEGTLYTPARPGLYVVRRFGTDAVAVDDFVVVEVPAETERFGHAHLSNPHRGYAMTGGAAIAYDVRPEHREAMARWTAKNLGLPLAIVLNDEVRATPILTEPLRDSITIVLEPDSRTAGDDPDERSD